VPIEEAPECADAEGKLLLGQLGLNLSDRDVLRLLNNAKDQRGMGLDPPRASIAALPLRPGIADITLKSAPADRARGAYPKRSAA
jgi:hypothetical protein